MRGGRVCSFIRKKKGDLAEDNKDAVKHKQTDKSEKREIRKKGGFLQQGKGKKRSAQTEKGF